MSGRGFVGAAAGVVEVDDERVDEVAASRSLRRYRRVPRSAGDELASRFPIASFVSGSDEADRRSGA